MEKTENTLLRHHLAEMERKHADAWNLGSFVSPTRIESKTSEGLLHSEINCKTKRITHDWPPRR
jgi:hypothetical protein